MGYLKSDGNNSDSTPLTIRGLLAATMAPGIRAFRNHYLAMFPRSSFPNLFHCDPKPSRSSTREISRPTARTSGQATMMRSRGSRSDGSDGYVFLQLPAVRIPARRLSLSLLRAPVSKRSRTRSPREKVTGRGGGGRIGGRGRRGGARGEQ